MRLLLTADPEIEVPPHTYGGIERIVDLLVRRLREAGHVVGLVSRPGSRCPADELYPWPGLSSLSKVDTATNALALWRAVKTFEPDVVHSFSRVAYLLPLLRGTIPIVMSYQRDPTLRTVALAARLARPGVLTFTGCSNYVAELGRAAGGDWHGIHNFTDVDALTFRSSVPHDAPLVFLSRIEAIKGVHWAIEIARRTGRRLIIAGNHSDGNDPEGEFWRQEIAPRIGKDGVTFVGPVDDARKNALLGQALAMLVPIQWDEPFGIVFVESLACGTPVIACPRGALPEIVRPGIDGFLVRSIEEGCQAVDSVGTLERLACRQRAEGHFSADVAVGRYLELYSNVGVALVHK